MEERKNILDLAEVLHKAGKAYKQIERTERSDASDFSLYEDSGYLIMAKYIGETISSMGYELKKVRQ